MPSPFPGMNPYLERPGLWADFHHRFLTYASDSLGPQVRPRYVVRIEEYVYIHELPKDQWRPIGRPDLAISDTGRQNSGATLTAPSATQGKSVVLQTTVDEVRVAYLEIRDPRDRTLITALELLSPSNKRNDIDRGIYQQKRLNYLTSSASFVEIDLLRGGVRPDLGQPPTIADYYVLISRAWERPKAEIIGVNLRERLPCISIPLKPNEQAGTLDLQDALNRAYDLADYESEIYLAPPEPPLSRTDLKWAEGFVPTGRNLP